MMSLSNPPAHHYLRANPSVCHHVTKPGSERLMTEHTSGVTPWQSYVLLTLSLVGFYVHAEGSVCIRFPIKFSHLNFWVTELPPTPMMKSDLQCLWSMTEQLSHHFFSCLLFASEDNVGYTHTHTLTLTHTQTYKAAFSFYFCLHESEAVKDSQHS